MNLRSNSLPGSVDPLATHTKEPHHPLPLPVTHCPSSTCLVPWRLDLPVSLPRAESCPVLGTFSCRGDPSEALGLPFPDGRNQGGPSSDARALRPQPLAPLPYPGPICVSIPLHRPPASSRLSPQPPPPPRLPRSPPRTPPPLLGLLTGQNRWLAGCFSPRLYPPLRSWTCLARTRSRPTGLSVTSRSPSAGGPLGRCASRSRFLRPLLFRSFPPLGSAPTELLLCFSWP